MFINLSLIFRFLEKILLVLGVFQKGKWDQKDLQLWLSMLLDLRSFMGLLRTQLRKLWPILNLGTKDTNNQCDNHLPLLDEKYTNYSFVIFFNSYDC